MPKVITSAQFKGTFCARTKRLRAESGRTQTEMAELLGVTYETYKKYETRSPLPHFLIPRFAELVHVEIALMFTGRRRQDESNLSNDRRRTG